MPGQPRAMVITGATGFIGAAVVKQALANGRLPLVITRPNSDLGRLSGLEGVQIFKSESLAEPSLANELRSFAPHAFLHLAWRGVGGAERNAAFQITDNLPLTLDAVRLAAAIGCKHWLGTGSQAEYGNPNRRVDEAQACNPTTLYGMAKLSSCWAAHALSLASGMKMAWVRIFSTYGPGDAPEWLIPYLIREFAAGRAPRLTKCEQLWDYLHVADAARGLLCVAEQEKEGIFNIGSGSAVALRKIVEQVGALANPKMKAEFGAVSYRPDQVMHLEADTSRLVRETGWKPQVDLETGLTETVTWFLNEKSQSR